MKYSKEQIEHSWKILKTTKEVSIRPVLVATINSVSKSGMSRRIEFYAVGKDGVLQRVGWYIAQVLGMPYGIDKGGILATGCGMDMVYHVVRNLNYAAGAKDGLSVKDFDYSGYFFDADKTQKL